MFKKHIRVEINTFAIQIRKMPIISSVSGIRGTIGGAPGNNLTPYELLAYLGAYTQYLRTRSARPKIVLGRDGRKSGETVNALVEGILMSLGTDIIQLGLSTTPSVEMAVTRFNADGGIILSASHNPKEWNALKLLNHMGEFISEEDGLMIQETAKLPISAFVRVDDLGKLEYHTDSIAYHVQKIIENPLVDVHGIRKRKFKVAADCINSTGAIALPILFEALGVEYSLLNEIINGEFQHNPEPLPEHLNELMSLTKQGFDLGISVDPDVDRLALVDANGNYFGEEYTLVAVADYVMDKKPGPSVSNLSSSRALRDLTLNKGLTYSASPVGEVHVVKEMKKVGAVIGGEGNGGIILPDLHYGRDAMIGIALLLSNLVNRNCKLSDLKANYPVYEMNKDKMTLPDIQKVDRLFEMIAQNYASQTIDRRDGLKIDFPNGWIHLRKSNTEPIVRIYSEARDSSYARKLGAEIKSLIESLN